jgi:DNA-binding transcriptional regulator YhcF (GntR family)
VQILKIDPGSYIPVSLQLKEQLRQLIRRGLLAPGSRLPSVRELAGFLRINRNTVLRVFSELESEGFLRSEHGRGVFVSASLPEAAAADIDVVIDEILERARASGVDAQSLALGILSRPQVEVHEDSAPRVLFTECNQPALRLFQAELRRGLNVQVDTALVRDLPQRLESGSDQSYQLLVTTFFHVEEVEVIASAYGAPVLGLLPEASLETLSRLINLRPGTAVGIVCSDPEGIENVVESLRRAGVNRLDLRTATAVAMAELVDQVEVVVTTRELAPRVRALAAEVEVIVEDGGVDRSGIELARRLLGAARKKEAT